MRDSANFYACLSPNFGDALGPWLIEKMMGTPAIYVHPHEDIHHYVLSGSVLNHIGPRSEVWGTGIASMCEGINNNATFRMVRGPISAFMARCNDCIVPDNVYGDAALVLPKILSPAKGKSHTYGVVPHYVDSATVMEAYRDKWNSPGEVKIINPFSPVEKFVEDVTSCRMIVSSSLHGLVVAQAYGIPFRWVTFTDKILGTGIKYWDFLMSVGLAGWESKPVADNFQDDNIGKFQGLFSDNRFQLGEFDIDKIWESFPLRG